MFNKNLLILLFLVIVASVLRLWWIGVVPISPDWDEAALGYNAYSIMETGRDEYGKPFPFILRSFNDYKPALYTYFIIPFVKLLGLNIISVRLPSAIFGILTVVGTYFLCKELFKKSPYLLKIKNWKLEIPEVTALLLAISPWHIQFSRVGFEANIGLAFNVFMALFFILGLRKPWFLLLSACFAGFNLYTYQNEKIFTPLLLLSLLIIYRKQVFSVGKKYLFSSFVLGLIIALPMVLYLLFHPFALQRATETSALRSDSQIIKNTNQRAIIDKNNNDNIGLIVDNKFTAFTKTIIKGYIAHFDLNWLFITGDIARHHVPGMGLLYFFELPFLLIGIYKLFFYQHNKNLKLLIFSWFLLAPIPASITTDIPHAVRTLNFLPTFQIFIAIGMLTTISLISNIKYQISNIQIKYFIFALWFLFFIFNFLYYFNQYFVQQNYFYAKEWQYGYKEIMPEIQKIQSKYKKIIVSDKQPMDQSYIFFLFYLSYNPSTYQKENIQNLQQIGLRHKYGKYEFRGIKWDQEQKSPDILYVGIPEDFPSDIQTIKTVYYPDNMPAIKIVKGFH